MKVKRQQMADFLLTAGNVTSTGSLFVNYVGVDHSGGGGGKRFVAKLIHKGSGRFVEVTSNQPCIQLETGLTLSFDLMFVF